MKDTFNEEQRRRAIYLMERLGISDRVIELYRKKGHIPLYFNGMYIRRVELSPKLRDKITSYEQRSGCMVYAVCKDYLYGCRFISLLFVSPYEEDWQWDITTHGNKHRVYAYVHNLDAEDLSESGSVLLESNDGRIKRIG